MKKHIFIIIFVLILLVGVFFRFYRLGEVPASLNWDEVSWGYNAYSIAMTGKDEYGTTFPLSFRAFGDYKQPMYVYLDALPTAVFGLTAFAVRFPSALIGSLTILSVFLLTRELFYKYRYRDYLSLVVMALFAVSPWSIQFSRVAFEANVGIFYAITGAWLFLLGFRKENPWIMAGSAVVISLSGFTYHSQKLFTPFLFIGLLFYAKDYLWKQKKILIVLLLVFFIVNSIWAFDMRTTARGRSVLFTSQQTEILKDSTAKLDHDREHTDLFGQVLHNRRIEYLQKYAENYLLHFEPNFLFLTGDNPRHHPPFMGVLYLTCLPFILFGLIRLIQTQKRVVMLILYWMLLAPIASALAVDAPNASRSLVFLPTWQILAGFGIVSVILVVNSKRNRMIAAAVIAAFYGVSILFYAHNYFAHTDTEFARDWQYGYKEAVRQIAERNKAVVFAPDVEQAYIFYLFHMKKDPVQYLAEGGSERISSDCFSIENAYFGRCLDRVSSGYLVTSHDPATNLKTLKRSEIHYPNGDSALSIYEFTHDLSIQE